MSKTKNPPAFPGEPQIRFGQPNDFNKGMTLRDYFAAAALGVRINYGANLREKELAEECYKIADAMLAEREKGQQ